MSVKVCAIDSRGIQRVVEEADPIRVKHLTQAPNAEIVRKRSGKIARINLRSFSDDSDMASHRGDPRKYYHRAETDENPPRVLTLRHLPSFTAPIFRTAVTDCIKKAA